MWPAVPMIIEGMRILCLELCALYLVKSGFKCKVQSTKYQATYLTISKSIHCVATRGFSFTRSVTTTCSTYSPGDMGLASCSAPPALNRVRSIWPARSERVQSASDAPRVPDGAPGTARMGRAERAIIHFAQGEHFTSLAGCEYLTLFY